MVIKCRLCAKGFAEANQGSMYTYSPTATRTGHRMVVIEASLKGWEIWSLDVSTAFLKGWTFEEMNKSGFKRQPCALRLPTDVWELLAELEPSNKLFKLAARNPELYCLELDKAAYGLANMYCTLLYMYMYVCVSQQ